MNPSTLAVLLIFSLPFVAVLAWVYVQRLDRPGAADSNLELRYQRAVDDLSDRVDALETERDALQQRVVNLETIVTSESWDDVHGMSTSSPPSSDASATNGSADNNLKDGISDVSIEDSASERAARIARNLRRS